MSKQLYQTLCNNDSDVPIFLQPWWLDATAGSSDWDVVCIERGGKVVAAMPYVNRRIFGQLFIRQPALTQHLGPWIVDTSSTQATRLSWEKELMSELIEMLPSYRHFQQNWHHSLKNWLPFYWKGFQQTTKYTYRINDVSDLETTWGALRDNIRWEIRKATDRYSLHVRTDLGLGDFLEINRMTFERQRMVTPFSSCLIAALDSACDQRGVRKIFIAEDPKGNRHAGVYIVWDRNSAYYLLSGADPKLRNSGATSLCIWEAIKFANSVSKAFDFEGSMIEPVERFIRGFGATQTPYHSICHARSWPFRLLFSLRK
jgi:hypothetical protein